ncbi:MAG TPA: SagB/ThcOx family dehydrogenase [Oceanithermus profundus]|uniref:SagB/ThcOx family dehydrogenase n=1 Tax=Oceanithermus profundus TaxID=187137 RepID=A0A7C4V7M6_9DEIN|nr:SagB/ThcOx family dehydrogenase [Oceanithermus profundus]
MKKKDFGHAFLAYTRLSPGQALPGNGQRVPTAKVYASPLETVDLPQTRKSGGPQTWRLMAQLQAHAPELELTLTAADLAQMLLPLSDREGRRGYLSSAGAYPVETYVVVRRVQDTFPGVYHYAVKAHQLEQIAASPDWDVWERALAGTPGAAHAAVYLVHTVVPARSVARLGPRGYRQSLLEAGKATHASFTAAVALGLAAREADLFYDEDVAQALGLPDGEYPVAVMIVGR